MSFFIVCMIMRSHNLLSFNLGIGDFLLQDLKRNAFKLICQLCTPQFTIQAQSHKHTLKRQAAPKGINGSKANSKCNMHPQI